MNPPSVKLVAVASPVLAGHNNGIKLKLVNVSWLLPWEADDRLPPPQHSGVRDLVSHFLTAQHEVEADVCAPH